MPAQCSASRITTINHRPCHKCEYAPSGGTTVWALHGPPNDLNEEVIRRKHHHFRVIIASIGMQHKKPTFFQGLSALGQTNERVDGKRFNHKPGARYPKQTHRHSHTHTCSMPKSTTPSHSADKQCNGPTKQCNGPMGRQGRPQHGKLSVKVQQHNTWPRLGHKPNGTGTTE
jgi:hypothetical protein